MVKVIIHKATTGAAIAEYPNWLYSSQVLIAASITCAQTSWSIVADSTILSTSVVIRVSAVSPSGELMRISVDLC